MKLSKKIRALSLGIVMVGVLFFNTAVLADNSLFRSQTLLQEVGGAAYNTKSPKDIKLTILQIIKTALSFLAIIAVVLLIVTGVQYMLSGGNDEKTKKALGNIKSLVIGLVIILISWGVVRYLLNVMICVTVQEGVNCSGPFWGSW